MINMTSIKKHYNDKLYDIAHREFEKGEIVLLGDCVIENLDIVISVDTSVAHLSASMGKPTWILLPFVPDWRWLLNRNDSPWYKSVKLFRQEKRGNWELVFKDLNKKLNVLYQ